MKRKTSSDRVVLFVAIGVLVLSLFQTYQINSMENRMLGEGQDDAIDMSGWTEDEIMIYEHHGTPPQSIQESSSSQAMVGGC